MEEIGVCSYHTQFILVISEIPTRCGKSSILKSVSLRTSRLQNCCVLRVYTATGENVSGPWYEIQNNQDESLTQEVLDSVGTTSTGIGMRYIWQLHRGTANPLL